MSTRMVNAMGYLDDDLITEAAERKENHHRTWMKWGFAAACLVITLVTALVTLPVVFQGKEPENALDKRYKNFTLQAQELVAIVWPWEYQTAGEKYRTLYLEGVEYGNTGNRLSESWLDESLGIHTVHGYDMIREESHEIQAQAFSLKSAAADMILAVKLENEYFVFRTYEYNPVNTLGELLDQVHLQEIVKLNWFEERGGASQGRRYVLNDASDFWDILTGECRDAVFVEDQNWMMRNWESNQESLNFSISSEVLGVRNVALYITTDGYLWTNAFGWQFIYDIGEESAQRIIRSCKENSAETEVRPFTNTIIGTITEITDDYFVVDDSSLCKDPKDGICYKVLLNDLRVSRYVMNQMIRIGDTVQVSYDGLIDENHGYVIESAVNVDKVIIVDGNAYTNE